MPEMIFVPQRSISKSGLGGGACKLPLQEDFGSFAASCLEGTGGWQQGGETDRCSVPRDRKTRMGSTNK